MLVSARFDGIRHAVSLFQYPFEADFEIIPRNDLYYTLLRIVSSSHSLARGKSLPTHQAQEGEGSVWLATDSNPIPT